ncbi:unnamed protein product [Mytilus coruscus]|uniref:non-specific serine/threonine protein kinase n=1 Tax=Mytilus coruscus TaxID=42192 RepID=A0A6J8APM6_MYTCO|nr:unnamed protein product [Mytilus coruscus]
MAPLSEEEDNYIRLTLLLKGVSARVVRLYFDREFPPTDLRSTLHKNTTTLQGLRSKRILNHPQWNLLFPSNFSVPDSNIFDVTGLVNYNTFDVPVSTSFDVKLMICLIRHLTPIIMPMPIDRLPRLSDTTPGADLARIKFHYNMIMFHESDKITTADFKTIWRDISGAIGRLGGHHLLKECAELRTKLLYQQISQTKDDKEKDVNVRNKIPDQITNMDETSIKIYLKALETGSERRRDINLVIVGKKGVGKTSLVRRLFGENIDDVKSTNGIEIHRRRCRISLNNWEWNKIPDTTAMKESSINNRLLLSMVKEIHQGRETENQKMSENSSFDVLESDGNEENKDNTATGQDLHFSSHKEFALSDDTTTSHSSELALQMLSSIIRPDLDLQDEDSHATLTVWDFAGDKEFYNTHQTFLTPEAIYIVVANLDDIDGIESYGTFNFWMDTIHCYGSIPEKPGDIDSILDPAVIAVGTHTDKIEDEEQCRELLASYTTGVFTDSNLHLRSTHLISNTDDQEDVFRELRNDIFAIANNGANWNREYPVKFIQIEKAINSELMNGKRIIPFERVKQLGSNTSMPISDEKELSVFLKYQHEVGNFLFFEDIPSYIILDPQWLANAFKCIVTADQFQLKIPHLDWTELRQTGKMDSKLLDAIFRTQSVDIRNHKTHILGVIEKFDIIIRPSLLMDSGIVQKDTCFYIPCMIQTSNIEDIDKIFKVPEDSKSTCLCFVFRFLPPHLISSLIVSCLRQYSLAAVGGQIGLFKESCVFNISRNGCAKFLLAKCNHIIELQIWQWGKVNPIQNQAVLKFVEIEIKRIIDLRYRMKTVSFVKKWKCESTSYKFDKDFNDFDTAQDGEDYICIEHGVVHRYKDHWSGEKFKVPSVLSKEQRNFTRLSMVVLDILPGVLYDRLDLDKNAGQLLFPCGQYDITSLYQEHRRLNKHIPNKGSWGGGRTMDDIPLVDTSIGDDIERIRLIRNEMQHSTVFALSDTRYQSLITIIRDMLTRFDQRNNPTGDAYVTRLKKIREMELKTRNIQEIMEQIIAELRKRFDEFVNSLASDVSKDI